MITNMPKDKLISYRAKPMVRMFRADPAQLTVGDKLDEDNNWQIEKQTELVEQIVTN